MKLRSYKSDLHQRLQDPEYAAGYLAQTLALNDTAAFLVALKDVVEVAGGISALSVHSKLTRTSLYKILSEEGNPRLSTLQEILKPLGFSISIVLADAA